MTSSLLSHCSFKFVNIYRRSRFVNICRHFCCSFKFGHPSYNRSKVKTITELVSDGCLKHEVSIYSLISPGNHACLVDIWFLTLSASIVKFSCWFTNPLNRSCASSLDKGSTFKFFFVFNFEFNFSWLSSQHFCSFISHWFSEPVFQKGKDIRWIIS